MAERVVFQIRMAKAFKERIISASAYEGKTMSEYIRDAIREKLKRDGK